MKLQERHPIDTHSRRACGFDRDGQREGVSSRSGITRCTRDALPRWFQVLARMVHNHPWRALFAFLVLVHLAFIAFCWIYTHHNTP